MRAAVRLHPLVQLTLVKLRDLLREPEAIFWVFFFPVLLSLALGIAFRSGDATPTRVGVVEGDGAAGIHDALEAAAGLHAELLDESAARQALRTGKVALVVRPGDPWGFWYDPTRPESRQAKLLVNDALQRAAGRVDPHAVATQELTERGSRYIDFLVPGLLGMNVMGTSMWGIGFYVVSARSKRLLKRLTATPMRRSHYLLSQLTGRLVFLVLEVGVVVGFGMLAFGVPQRGSWLLLALVGLAGSATFGGIGLLVAARPRTVEGVSGLMNVVMMPMWICSGTFFSTARFPDAVQPWIQLLPLTALNDALRAVMLDGASLAAVSGELAISLVWAAASFAAALYLFRWS
jgi:ABC-type multidrug transport system permease subunit